MGNYKIQVMQIHWLVGIIIPIEYFVGSQVYFSLCINNLSIPHNYVTDSKSTKVVSYFE